MESDKNTIFGDKGVFTLSQSHLKHLIHWT